MKIHDLAEIHPMTAEQLPEYANVIRRSFATVAKDFGFTRENCPGHTSFITDEKLKDKIKDGYYPFGLYLGSEIIGFVSLVHINNGVYEMNEVSVLPEWRHYGYGKMMLEFCKEKVRELNGVKIIIGIIEDNTTVKNWYAANGFVHIGKKNFAGLPFTVGLMEWEA